MSSSAKQRRPRAMHGNTEVFTLFWDRVAPLYDFFENTFNRAVYDGTGEAVARMIRPDDRVLECACGTGAISVAIAPVCARLVATDYSEGMLSQARKKLATHSNVTVEQADITALSYATDSFDVAVAGNVIHLLPDPAQALRELARVVKPGGMIIVPTYVSLADGANNPIPRLLSRLGVRFQEHFTPASYQAFVEGMGYDEARFRLVRGRIPCAIAVFPNRKQEG